MALEIDSENRNRDSSHRNKTYFQHPHGELERVPSHLQNIHDEY